MFPGFALSISKCIVVMLSLVSRINVIHVILLFISVLAYLGYWSHYVCVEVPTLHNYFTRVYSACISTDESKSDSLNLNPCLQVMVGVANLHFACTTHLSERRVTDGRRPVLKLQKANFCPESALCYLELCTFKTNKFMLYRSIPAVFQYSSRQVHYPPFLHNFVNRGLRQSYFVPIYIFLDTENTQTQYAR